MSQQDDARDILAALRGEPGTEVLRPETPNVTGLTDDARNKVQAAYDRQMDAHVAYLMTKKSSTLTKDEQETLGREVGRYFREQRG